jgi:hypothetical protein
MRLYHYLEAKWALDDIKRKRLKFSKIDDMNDPYEAACVISDDILTQFALEKSVAEVCETWGALCFSPTWESVLMWSHYGDRHKGMCLGFDVSDTILRPVEYVKKPIMIGAMIVFHKDSFDLAKAEAIVNQLLGTKYEDWSYEKEVRVHITREEKDPASGHYFADFGDKCALREIIIGTRCQTDMREVEAALSGYPDRSSIKIIRARASSTSFKIVARTS